MFGSCPQGCGATLIVADVETHLAEECTMRIIVCSQCNSDVLFQDMEEHKKLFCPNRLLHCARGCGAVVREVDREMHEKDDCLRRLTRCKHGCGKEVFFADREEHENSKCRRRIVQCPNRCNENVPLHQLDMHMTVCERRIIPCGSGGKHCARPLRAWVHGNVSNGEGHLNPCRTHSETGLTWAVRNGDLKLAAAILDRVCRTL